jgi:hypothetical protein
MEGLKFHNQEKMKNPINIALLLVVMEVNALHLLLLNHTIFICWVYPYTCPRRKPILAIKNRLLVLTETTGI